eukprot:COSAG06_NODE_257_length_18972_cov_14.659196_15_plen_153_part_00
MGHYGQHLGMVRDSRLDKNIPRFWSRFHSNDKNERSRSSTSSWAIHLYLILLYRPSSHRRHSLESLLSLVCPLPTQLCSLAFPVRLIMEWLWLLHLLVCDDLVAIDPPPPTFRFRFFHHLHRYGIGWLHLHGQANAGSQSLIFDLRDMADAA